jgi:predicted RNase H-like HicB family nuclease
MKNGTQAESARYSMIIEWSDADDAYIVTVPELPGCRTHGATRAEAVAMGDEAIVGWIDAMRSWGQPVPGPRVFAAEPEEVRTGA